jgi:hypothetical protein
MTCHIARSVLNGPLSNHAGSIEKPCRAGPACHLAAANPDYPTLPEFAS